MNQVSQQNAVSYDFLEGFNEFFTHFLVEEFVHAEYDASFARKWCGNLFSVDKPERTGHSFLNEISIFAEYIFSYQ